MHLTYCNRIVCTNVICYYISICHSFCYRIFFFYFCLLCYSDPNFCPSGVMPIPQNTRATDDSIIIPDVGEIGDVITTLNPDPCRQFRGTICHYVRKPRFFVLNWGTTVVLAHIVNRKCILNMCSIIYQCLCLYLTLSLDMASWTSHSVILTPLAVCNFNSLMEFVM